MSEGGENRMRDRKGIKLGEKVGWTKRQIVCLYTQQAVNPVLRTGPWCQFAYAF